MNPLLRYGLIAGLVLCTIFFAPFFVFGAKPEWLKLSELIGYTSMVLCLSATWFAMRKEQDRRGPLRFGRAFGIGIGVSSVAGLMFGLGTWLFFIVVGDSLPQALFEFHQAQIRASGEPTATIATRLAELDSMRDLYFNRPLQGAVMGATVFLIGAVESLIGAWLIARGGRRPVTA
jgi:hypothetical protein